jgi:hypothetical protein
MKCHRLQCIRVYHDQIFIFFLKFQFVFQEAELHIFLWQHPCSFIGGLKAAQSVWVALAGSKYLGLLTITKLYIMCLISSSHCIRNQMLNDLG